MNFTRIFVLGAGAIGSSYGALLSRKNDVTLIGNSAHVDTINSSGLILSGDIQEIYRIKAERRIKKIPSDSLILLTTKAHDSTRAIEEIEDLLKEDTAILILQNGLGNKDLVKGIVGDDVEVLRGLVKIAAEFLEPGKITFWNGETVLEKRDTGERIAALFNESGLKARASSRIDREIWNKLIVNCVVNPLTAILQARDNEVVVDTLRQLRHGIVDECVEVGQREGMTFKSDLKKSVDRCISRFANRSSMYQDIIRGKKTEIDFLNGKIVKLGSKYDIPTPINKALVSMIKFLERKR